jgi:hypothetical protein
LNETSWPTNSVAMMSQQTRSRSKASRTVEAWSPPRRTSARQAPSR